MKEYKFEIDSKVKMTLLMISIICFLTFIVLITGTFNTQPYTEAFKEVLLHIDFNNDVVKSKYIDKANHGSVTYTFLKSEILLNSFPYEWDLLIDVGDTINKKPNQLIMYLSKKNGEKYTLDYQDYLNRIDSLNKLDK